MQTRVAHKVSSNKDMRAALKYAKEHGFTVTHGGKHLKLTKNGQVVTASVSPSCPHAADGVRRDVDRIERRLKERKTA